MPERVQTVIHDSFTGTNGTLISTRSPDVGGGSWQLTSTTGSTPQILDNQARPSSPTANFGAYVLSSNLPSRNYEVRYQCGFPRFDFTGSLIAIIYIRVNTGNVNSNAGSYPGYYSGSIRFRGADFPDDGDKEEFAVNLPAFNNGSTPSSFAIKEIEVTNRTEGIVRMRIKGNRITLGIGLGGVGGRGIIATIPDEYIIPESETTNRVGFSIDNSTLTFSDTYLDNFNVIIFDEDLFDDDFFLGDTPFIFFGGGSSFGGSGVQPGQPTGSSGGGIIVAVEGGNITEDSGAIGIYEDGAGNTCFGPLPDSDFMGIATIIYDTHIQDARYGVETAVIFDALDVSNNLYDANLNAGVVARAPSLNEGTDYYFCSLEATGPYLRTDTEFGASVDVLRGTLVLGKNISGIRTTLVTDTVEISNGREHLIGIEVLGDQIYGIMDGAVLLDTNDNSLTAIGHAGITFNRDNVNGNICFRQFRIYPAQLIEDDPIFNDFVPWYNSAWDCRKKITVPKEKVSGQTAPYVMRVFITDPDLALKAKSDGSDILFTDIGGALLNYQRLDYDNSTGFFIADVLVGSLSGFSDNIFYMYYDNPSATEQSGLGQVFDTTRWDMVLHLNESGNGTLAEYKDSARTNHAQGGGGTATSVPSRVLGNCGYAQSFDGVDDFIKIPNDSRLYGSARIVLSCWVRPNAIEDDKRIIHKSRQTLNNTSNEYSLRYEGTKVQIDYDTGPDHTIPENVSSDAGEWKLIHFEFNTDNQQNYLYINGEQQTPGPTNENDQMNVFNDINNYVSIGGGQVEVPTDWFFNGLIHEVRIHRPRRTPGEYKTEYNNQSDPGSFHIFSGEECLSNRTVSLVEQVSILGNIGIDGKEIKFNEPISVLESLLVNGIKNIKLDEPVSIADAIKIFARINLTESVSIAELLRRYDNMVRITETVSINEVIAGIINNIKLTEQVSVNDTIDLVISIALIENISIAELIIATRRLTEQITIGELIGLLKRQPASERVSIGESFRVIKSGGVEQVSVKKIYKWTVEDYFFA